MEKKLRILQLSPRFPFPADDGGRISIANTLKEFSSQGAEVTLFAYLDKDMRNNIDTAKKFADVVVSNHSYVNTPLRILGSVFSSQPLYLTKHIDDDVKRQLDKILEEKEFDIIHADHSAMAPLGLYAKSKINKPLGIRLHNVEWLIWHRYAETVAWWNPKKYYIKRQAELLKKAEGKLYEQADVCFSITEPDRQRAMEIAPNANVIVSLGGVNLEEWKPESRILRNKYEIAIATSFFWIHNVTGIKWFLDNVFPAIKMEFPEVIFTMIGKNPPKWLKEYKNGVNLEGYVPKVQPYLSRANIYVTPLFVGGGMRIKILEAMAMELPIVATSIAAEGIDATENDGLFIADDAETFAAKTIELIRHFIKARQAGINARKYAIEHFSWDKNVKIMLDEYKRLAGISV